MSDVLIGFLVGLVASFASYNFGYVLRARQIRKTLELEARLAQEAKWRGVP